MSPRKFEEIADEYEAEGLDVTELRAAWDASPLRRERDEIKAQAEATLERANTYRSRLLAHEFSALGIKAKPDALKIPDDLDLDSDKVREWAVNSGLIDAPEPDPEPDEGVEGHARVTAAAQGAPARGGVISPDDAAEWDQAKWKRFETSHPVEAEALSRGEQVKGLTF